MSGPKVVRIVTREEVLALCERDLQRLQTAIEHWQEQARAIGELDASELAATLARRDRLRALIGEDRLVQLQKEVVIEIDFLKHDLREREERAIARLAQARQQQRRVKENATTLIRALQARDDLGNAELLDAIAQLADGSQRDNAEALLAHGFAALSQLPAVEVLSDAQQKLAQSLRTNEASLSLQQWGAAQQQDAPREKRLARIDRHIAELQLLQGAGSTHEFLEKLVRAEAEQRAPQRNLLLDSLVLDLADATRTSQQQRSRLQALQDLATEVAALERSEHAELLQSIAACGITTIAQELTALTEQCNAILATHLQQQAALARRQAVLQGLASLGYEVREGMATAWADTGKVVLRKTAMPGYGVEVGGKADNGRLQVRAVALSPDRDTQRDRDIETIWCGEFKRLQALLKDSGSELIIEQALAVGAVPLKEVAYEASTQQTDHSADANRTL